MGLPGKYSKPLPVDERSADIVEKLRIDGLMVLTSPTGTGKSTRVPSILADSGLWPGRVLVLEPRRMAARFLARRVAEDEGGSPGNRIGYMTRFDSRVSSGSAIVYITEGILPVLARENPCLDGIGAIVFDEYHERSMATDLGLGLAMAIREKSRPDLALLVMSATLDPAPLLEYLGTRAHLALEERVHPVEIIYAPGDSRLPLWSRAAEGVGKIFAPDGIRRGGGKAAAKPSPVPVILIFMPGKYEIRKTMADLAELTSRGSIPRDAEILPLHGELSIGEQDRVMAPPDGPRIIVATSIAETSLTLPGVTHVIDSGLSRFSRYDPDRGIDVMTTGTVSRFSADQRAGRAGRNCPGACIRLWTQEEQRRKADTAIPEVMRADLAQPVQQILSLGLSPESFRWPTHPGEERITRALELLKLLGAIEYSGETPEGRGLTTVTSIGKAMARFPTHPRFSRMIIAALDHGVTAEVCILAAALSDRPFVSPWPCGSGGAPEIEARAGDSKSDFAVLVSLAEEASRRAFDPAWCSKMGVDPGAAKRICQSANSFEKIIRNTKNNEISASKQNSNSRMNSNDSTADSGRRITKAALYGFPDRLAASRDGTPEAYFIRGSKAARLSAGSRATGSGLIVAAELRETGGSGREVEAVLSVAGSLEPEWLKTAFPHDWNDLDTHQWNSSARQVERIRTSECLGVPVSRLRGRDVDPGEASVILARELGRNRLALRGWDEKVEAWISRVRWVAETFPDQGLITYDDTDIELVIAEICQGEYRFEAVRDRPCLEPVMSALSWKDRDFVEKMAPERLPLPGGRHLKVSYAPGRDPVGRARIQELYGLETSPTVANGKIGVLLEILGPNMRPLQLTKDIGRFWTDLYPTLKKALQRRYPRHEWR